MSLQQKPLVKTESEKIEVEQVQQEVISEVVKIAQVEPVVEKQTEQSPEQIFKSAVTSKWGQNEWQPAKTILGAESGLNPYAINKSSGACGAVQALPCSKLLKVIGSLSNVKGQADWFVAYIENRYGNPSKALHFRNNIAPTYDHNGDGIADGSKWY